MQFFVPHTFSSIAGGDVLPPPGSAGGASVNITVNRAHVMDVIEGCIGLKTLTAELCAVDPPGDEHRWRNLRRALGLNLSELL